MRTNLRTASRFISSSSTSRGKYRKKFSTRNKLQWHNGCRDANFFVVVSQRQSSRAAKPHISTLALKGLALLYVKAHAQRLYISIYRLPSNGVHTSTSLHRNHNNHKGQVLMSMTASNVRGPNLMSSLHRQVTIDTPTKA